MKITALLVMKWQGDSIDPVILANACDVSQFGYFQRSGAKEFIVFVGRTVAKRTPPAQRQSVQHQEYKVHSYNKNGLCALGFMDDNYPVRSAFSLLNKVLEEYQKNFGDSWRNAQADVTQPWPYLNEALTKFQDPAEADKLLKIQRDLDETKIILVSAEIVQDFTCNAFCGLPITLLLFPCAFAPYFDFLQDKFLSFFQFLYSLACSVLRKKKKIVFVGNKEVM
ncbi:hypothetical protein AAG906_006409 [Vitis piasezkii]